MDKPIGSIAYDPYSNSHTECTMSESDIIITQAILFPCELLYELGESHLLTARNGYATLSLRCTVFLSVYL